MRVGALSAVAFLAAAVAAAAETSMATSYFTATSALSSTAAAAAAADTSTPSSTAAAAADTSTPSSTAAAEATSALSSTAAGGATSAPSSTAAETSSPSSTAAETSLPSSSAATSAPPSLTAATSAPPSLTAATSAPPSLTAATSAPPSSTAAAAATSAPPSLTAATSAPPSSTAAAAATSAPPSSTAAAAETSAASTAATNTPSSTAAAASTSTAATSSLSSTSTAATSSSSSLSSSSSTALGTGTSGGGGNVPTFAPAHLRVVSHDKGALLTWDAPDDLGSSGRVVCGYEIQLSTNVTFSPRRGVVLGAAARSLAIDAYPNVPSYFLRCRTLFVEPAADSAWSEVVSVDFVPRDDSFGSGVRVTLLLVPGAVQQQPATFKGALAKAIKDATRASLVVDVTELSGDERAVVLLHAEVGDPLASVPPAVAELLVEHVWTRDDAQLNALVSSVWSVEFLFACPDGFSTVRCVEGEDGRGDRTRNPAKELQAFAADHFAVTVGILFAIVLGLWGSVHAYRTGRCCRDRRRQQQQQGSFRRGEFVDSADYDEAGDVRLPPRSSRRGADRGSETEMGFLDSGAAEF